MSDPREEAKKLIDQYKIKGAKPNVPPEKDKSPTPKKTGEQAISHAMEFMEDAKKKIAVFDEEISDLKTKIADILERI